MNNLTTLLATLIQDGAGDAPTESGGTSFLFPMLAILAIFWFVLIMPQRKEQKKREAMLGGMKKGDEVMTTSGIYARIAQVQDDVITLQVADGVRMKFSRAAIQSIVNNDDAEAEKSGKD